jgi:transposase-like protein
MLTVVTNAEETPAGPVDGGSLIDEIVRDGARRMLAAALEAEVAAYIAAHAGEIDERGHRLVVRNGHAVPRQVLTSAGAVEVRAPRVNDKRVDEVTGERRRYASAILPAWCRRSPKVTEVLPLLYLHGLSSKDFGPALEEFLGTDAGLSAATITRLTVQWQDEARRFNERDLSGVDYVYVWADGIHVNVRLDEEKLCLLVLIGVRVDGTKQLVALADGYRESTGSWADLLRDCKRRGMRAPVLAVGDGALGFWGALREVFPATREQRCWFHKIANVLSALPKSAHPGAKKALRRQVRQGRRQGHRRPGPVARLLRLPGRALGPPAHHEPDRVDLRHGPQPKQDHQGSGVEERRHRHGIQAHRGRAGPLARRQRAAPRRARPRRRHLQTRQAR